MTIPIFKVKKETKPYKKPIPVERLDNCREVEPGELVELSDYPGYFVTREGNIYRRLAGVTSKDAQASFLYCKGYVYKQLNGYFKECPITGYSRLCVFLHGKHNNIHTLIAKTFVPNPKGHNTVRYKNNDPYDNRADNLEWYYVYEPDPEELNYLEKRLIDLCDKTDLTQGKICERLGITTKKYIDVTDRLRAEGRLKRPRGWRSKYNNSFGDTYEFE